MRSCLMSCLALLLVTPAGAQRAITLTKPDAEYAEAFSSIAGVRALRDGRLIVSDSRDKTVQLIDFAGPAKAIGREGRGPREWLLPNGLASLPGDSTALWDAGNRRFLRIAPNGTPTDAFQPERMHFGPLAAMRPRGSDARGNIYFQGSPFTTIDGQPAPAESVAVLRIDRARNTVDTVAFVRPQKGNARLTSDGAGRPGVGNGMGNPLVPLDDFAVLPDGRVAVFRAPDYRMDVYADRVVKLVGPRVPYTPTPVDAATKNAVLEQRRRQLAAANPRSLPDGAASAPLSDAMKRFMDIEPWPATMPPFFRGAAVVRTAGPTTQIWVLRASVKDTEPPRYDVFDEGGRVIATVQLPLRTRAVAFSGTNMFAIRTDDDDLQYLQRFRLPAF